MITYSHEGGYGNVNLNDVRDVLDKVFLSGSVDKITLLELLYDYECLLRVIEGKGACFRHVDGSETRRLKLYGS